MKKLTFLLVGLFCLASVVGHALAKSSYKYAIRIKNDTKHKIKIVHAKYQIKKSSKESCKSIKGKRIKSGKSERCSITNALGQTKTHRWFVVYKCDGKKRRAKSGWFKASSTHSDATTLFVLSKCDKTQFLGP